MLMHTGHGDGQTEAAAVLPPRPQKTTPSGIAQSVVQ